MSDVYFTSESPHSHPYETTFEKLPGEGWDKLVVEDRSLGRLPLGTRDRDRAFYHPLGADTHRWIAQLYSFYPTELYFIEHPSEDLKAEIFYNLVISPIFHTHGDLFARPNNQTPRNIFEWKAELETLVDAVPLVGTDSFEGILQRTLWNSSLHTRLQPPPLRDRNHADITVTYKDNITFHARNLLGWLWVLCARDHIEGVTYTRCESGCTREVPTPSLPFPKQKQRVLKYCGVMCGDTARARRARERKANNNG